MIAGCPKLEASAERYRKHWLSHQFGGAGLSLRWDLFIFLSCGPSLFVQASMSSGEMSTYLAYFPTQKTNNRILTLTLDVSQSSSLKFSAGTGVVSVTVGKVVQVSCKLPHEKTDTKGNSTVVRLKLHRSLHLVWLSWKNPLFPMVATNVSYFSPLGQKQHCHHAVAGTFLANLIRTPLNSATVWQICMYSRRLLRQVPPIL